MASIGYILQVMGLSLGFLSALLLTLVEIKRRKQIIAESATCWDENPAVRKDLKQKSTVAIISTILLFSAFFLQLVGFIMG